MIVYGTFRKPVVLHHNCYDPEGYRSYLEGYEEAYRRFREEQGMRPRPWQAAVHESTTSMAYMGGRENLREMVTKRGFGLR